jgi:hypothetical protein
MGLANAKKTWIDRTKRTHSGYSGPSFINLSEPVQNSIMEFLYEAGIRPELGLCVEYLSWNKEQRLYMAWLRDLYFHINKETQTLI